MTTNRDEFQARLDASLRRSFAPTADPASILVRARAARSQSAGDAAASGEQAATLWAGAGLLAAAASVLIFLARGPVSGPLEDPLVEDAFAGLGWIGDRSVGPLLELAGGDELDHVRRPDLAAIYAEVVQWTETRGWHSCREGGVIEDSLRRSYGHGLTLTAHASNQLQGPFSSPEWPTGTIMTGFPENETAVLIAERSSTHNCCVEYTLPPESGLNVFTWPVGDIVLTEISPLSEPRLFDYIVEVAQADW